MTGRENQRRNQGQGQETVKAGDTPALRGAGQGLDPGKDQGPGTVNPLDILSLLVISIGYNNTRKLLCVVLLKGFL